MKPITLAAKTTTTANRTHSGRCAMARLSSIEPVKNWTAKVAMISTEAGWTSAKTDS